MVVMMRIESFQYFKINNAPTINMFVETCPSVKIVELNRSAYHANELAKVLHAALCMRTYTCVRHLLLKHIKFHRFLRCTLNNFHNLLNFEIRKITSPKCRIKNNNQINLNLNV